jgi:hypothetical protein
MVPGIWIFYAKGTGHTVSLLSSTAKQVKSGLDPFFDKTAKDDRFLPWGYFGS